MARTLGRGRKPCPPLSRIIGGILIFIYIIAPLVVWLYPTILTMFVFANSFGTPFVHLSNPAASGVANGRNLYLQVEEDVHIGAWHILPSSITEMTSGADKKEYDTLLSTGKTIFIYLHGNGGNRGSWTRKQMYHLLSSLDAHVIAVDYRGYGDSTGFPTEDGLIADSRFIYKWVKKRSGASKIILWGHSLGTGVATRLAKELCREGDCPSGVVLEGAFNNLEDMVSVHPFSLPYRLFPWYMSFFKNSLKKTGTEFASEKHIKDVATPIFMVHSEDDRIIPVALAEKLFAVARETHKNTDVQMVVLGGNKGYGHLLCFKSPELPGFIRRFLDKMVQNKTQ